MFEQILRSLVADLKERGELDLTEFFLDGTFVIAKKGARPEGTRWVRSSATQRVPEVRKSWQWRAHWAGTGLPLALSAFSATPHEVTLVDATLDALLVDEMPHRLIGDKAYASDPHDAHVAANRQIELIAPHKRNRQKLRPRDGRKLRRYKRRWMIEQLFAWLQNYRRILVHFDYKLANYLGFVHLGAASLILRRYF